MLIGMRYILDDHHQPVPCEDLRTWAIYMDRANRHVADETIGGVRVSTVFLGLDYNFSGQGWPLLFETMIFGGKRDGDQWPHHCCEERR